MTNPYTFTTSSAENASPEEGQDFILIHTEDFQQMFQDIVNLTSMIDFLLERYGVAFDVYYDSHSAASAHGHKTWQAYYAGGDGPEVQVTTTENVKVCYVTLTSQALDSILENRLNSDQQEVYDIYYEAAGNRQFLGTPVDYDWHYNVSRYYGYYCDGTTVTNHDGLDLTFPAGINVLSPIDGTVSQTGQTSEQGKFMVISNDKGYEIKYTHLQSISKPSGAAVVMGDVVAKVGSTGNVSTPTLHIEFRHQGEAYDPYFYLQTGTEILVSSGAIGPGGGGALPGIVLPAAGKQAALLTEAFKHLGKTVDMDYRDLEAMVQEINANEVDPADRLSDHVYEYDAKDHELFRSDRAEERQAEKAAKKEKAKEKTEEKKPSVLGKLKDAQEKVNSTPVQAGPAHKKEVSL